MAEQTMSAAMQFDVVAIGGGFSGLVTACRAAELGRSVVVLEARAEERYPCSSRYATGACNIMGLPILLEPDRLFEAIVAGSGANADPAVARAIAENGKRTIAWLTQEGAEFSSRALRKDQPGQQVLAPPRQLTAGLDWEDRGADVLMRRLEANLTRRGSVLMRNTKAAALVADGGACVGVDAVRDGKPLRIAAKAVVIADGGFWPIPTWWRNTSRRAPIGCWPGSAPAPKATASAWPRRRARRSAASALFMAISITGTP
jgi:fumarate reductase flavoprotein subunit